MVGWSNPFGGPSAATPRERRLADALLAASPSLRWIAPYQPGDGADALAAGYAVTMLVGTGIPPRPGYQVPFVNPDVLVTFTLQAPGLFYPLHRHKAPEIYHVISGAAQWRRDGEPWRQRLPGEWFFHASEQGHAMRTGARASVRTRFELDPAARFIGWRAGAPAGPPAGSGSTAGRCTRRWRSSSRTGRFWSSACIWPVGAKRSTPPGGSGDSRRRR